MAVLTAWHAHQGEPRDDAAIVSDDDIDYERKRLATALRADLRAVGVTRALLFEEDAPNVEALRFHDLRSTFCTWARRAGKSHHYSTVAAEEKKHAIAKVIELSGVRKALRQGASPRGGVQSGVHGPKDTKTARA